MLVYRPHNLYNNESVQENNDKLCKVISESPRPCIILRDFNMSAGSMMSNRSNQNGGRFNEDHEEEDESRELVKILVIVYIILKINKKYMPC